MKALRTIALDLQLIAEAIVNQMTTIDKKKATP
jgi:hypothetical protein